MIQRRGLVLGLLAAPALVRSGLVMPVKPWKPAPMTWKQAQVVPPFPPEVLVNMKVIICAEPIDGGDREVLQTMSGLDYFDPTKPRPFGSMYVESLEKGVRRVKVYLT